MVSRKYSNDYRLSETVLPDGRIKAEAVYIGGDYFFTSDAKALRKTRAACLLLSSVCWAAFICALVPLSRASRLMYVILPHACCFIPLAFLSESVWYLWRSGAPMTHERSDKISKGIPANSLLCLIFSASAFIGFAATAAAAPGTMLRGDILFGVSSALLSAASAMIFSRRGTVKTDKS